MLLALAVAIAAFWLPQEAPLRWTASAGNGSGILYLEVRTASDRPGNLLIFPRIDGRFDSFHSIHLPLSASRDAYTYTFPLPDLPVFAFRLHPPVGEGVLRIEHLRVITRRGDLALSLDLAGLAPLQQIRSVHLDNGIMSITSAEGADDARLQIDLPSPLLAEGAVRRNWHRATHSIAYLAGFVWLGLMAIALVIEPTLRHPRQALRVTIFFALLAIAFAVIGHRSHLRDTVLLTLKTPRQNP